MLRRVLIIILIKYTDEYLSSMLYVVVFMFVAHVVIARKDSEYSMAYAVKFIFD
jgi:hypothetical protein